MAYIRMSRICYCVCFLTQLNVLISFSFRALFCLNVDFKQNHRRLVAFLIDSKEAGLTRRGCGRHVATSPSIVEVGQKHSPRSNSYLSENLSILLFTMLPRSELRQTSTQLYFYATSGLLQVTVNIPN